MRGTGRVPPKGGWRGDVPQTGQDAQNSLCPTVRYRLGLFTPVEKKEKRALLVGNQKAVSGTFGSFEYFLPICLTAQKCDILQQKFTLRDLPAKCGHKIPLFTVKHAVSSV